MGIEPSSPAVIDSQDSSLATPPFSRALTKFLGLPFLEDGAQNMAGQWVTFNQPHQPLSAGGFNCSGFTVAAVREILGQPVSLLEATRDRRGDSGLNSLLGQDWDFGLDLILNLARGHPGRLLPRPADLEASPIDSSLGRPFGWGVDIHSAQFEEILAELVPGSFTLFAMSKPHRGFGAGVAYYHVGVILPEPPHLWLYHSTVRARTHRIDLAASRGLSRFRNDFRPRSGIQRRMLLLEVSPVQPGSEKANNQ